MQTVPTIEEIEQLPRWARVAFAARCARRVEPLYTIDWPEAPAKHIEALDIAITMAEKFAAHTGHSGKAYEYFMYAEDAARAARSAIDADDATNDADAAAFAAAQAAHAADDDGHYAARHAVDAARAAVRAANAADDGGFTVTGIRRDFDFLIKQVRENKCDDGTPVPPSAFGPMWPDGEPQWLHEDRLPSQPTEHAERTPSEPISLYFDLNEFSPQEITEFLGDLSAVYASLSDGDELVIDDMTVLDTSDALVPSGGGR